VDADTKAAADSLFHALGIDTPTAVRMFITAAIDRDGMPFKVTRPKRKPNAELLEAMEDARLGRNLHGPFKTVDEAMQALLED